MKKFWTCFVEGASGGIHWEHATRPDAEQEAARLARLPGNKGRRVYVMEMVCYCIAVETPVECHEAEVSSEIKERRL